MSDKFDASYYVKNIYLAGSVPNSVVITSDDISDDMTYEDLETLYFRKIADHFVENVSAVPTRHVNEFIDWAIDQLEKE
jgi:hypothetical protein